jgi:hypothetical protein
MDFLAAIFKFEGVGGPWKLAAYVLIPAAIATTIAIIIAASILPAKKRADVAKL